MSFHSSFIFVRKHQKPQEIRLIEKLQKKEHRKKQEIFFCEMETNLLSSLARGEIVPGMCNIEKQGPPQEPLYDLPKPRIRTLSAVNEHLLAQMSQQQQKQDEMPQRLPQPAIYTSTSTSPIQGRPPLPSLRSTPKVTEVPKVQQNSTASVTRNTPSYSSMDSLELSPEENNDTKSVITAAEADLLRGIDLLDEGGSDKQKQLNPTECCTNSNTKNIPKKLALHQHVRSHTAGRVVHDTMERPDIDATIDCVCSVYRLHVENSLQSPSQPQPSPVAARINFDLFRDDYEYMHRINNTTNNSNTPKSKAPRGIPSVSTIQAFYKEFYQRSQMEHDTIIMSLIYVERLMKATNGALQPTPDNWSSVLIACMILASKVWGKCFV